MKRLAFGSALVIGLIVVVALRYCREEYRITVTAPRHIVVGASQVHVLDATGMDDLCASIEKWNEAAQTLPSLDSSGLPNVYSLEVYLVPCSLVEHTQYLARLNSAEWYQGWQPVLSYMGRLRSATIRPIALPRDMVWDEPFSPIIDRLHDTSLSEPMMSEAALRTALQASHPYLAEESTCFWRLEVRWHPRLLAPALRSLPALGANEVLTFTELSKLAWLQPSRLTLAACEHPAYHVASPEPEVQRLIQRLEDFRELPASSTSSPMPAADQEKIR